MDIPRNEKGQILPGHTGNPKGRPKGRFSITSLIIEELKTKPDLLQEVIKWILDNRKDLVWRMIDPEPPKDLNLGGQAENPVRVVVIEKPDEAIPPAV